MKSTYRQHCVLLLLLACLALEPVLTQGESPEPREEASTVEGSSEETTAERAERMNEESSIAGEQRMNDAPPEDQPADPNEESCQDNEIFTVERGCVDRAVSLQKVLLSAWARLQNDTVHRTVCDKSQTLVDGNCVSQHEARRVAVQPAYFHNGQVYESAAAVLKKQPNMPFEDNEVNERSPNNPGEKEGIVGFPGNRLRANIEPTEPSSLDKVIGHNRPRKYAFMPGRLLKTHRKCRPYEVLGINKRCIRKKGKVGFYKHRNHVYGSQKRHRHEAAYRQNQAQ